MRLSLKTTTKIFVETVWDTIRNLCRKFITAFQEWWAFYKTRNIWFLKKFWKGILVFGSAYITYWGLVFGIFLRDWLLTMNVVFLITIFLLIPVLFFGTILVYSLRPKWRNELDKWIRYGEFSNKERLRNCETRLDGVETRLSSIDSILRDINDKLDRHIQERHHG